MLCRDVSDDAVAVKRRFAIEPLLRADRHIGVQQTADADDHDRAMGEDITPFIGGALLGRNQGGIVFGHQLGLVAPGGNPCDQLLRQHSGRRS